MRLYHAFGGGVTVWRQSSDAYVPATVKRTRGYSVRAFNDQVLVNGVLGSSLTSITKDFSFAYGVMGAVSKDLALGYSVLGVAQKDLPLAYNVVGSVQQDLPLAYAVVGTVSRDLGLAYDIQGEGVVTRDLMLSYTIVGSVQRDLAINYGIATSVEKDLPLGYKVVGSVVKDLGLSYQIEGSGGGTADPAEVWAFVLPNGKTAAQTVMETHAMMAELYRIHGLQAGAPLVVGKTTRTAGDIEQTIQQAGDEVTVTRTG